MDADTRTRVAALAAELVGTSGIYDQTLLEAHGITQSMDEIEALIEEYGVVRCSHCGWWVEADDISGEDRCEDCRTDDNEDNDD